MGKRSMSFFFQIKAAAPNQMNDPVEESLLRLLTLTRDPPFLQKSSVRFEGLMSELAEMAPRSRRDETMERKSIL